MTALSPEPHTLLTVSAATWSGSPPRSAACRAGFCPSPADTTFPMMHSSTIPESMPARRMASATTRAPSCGAVRLFNAPRNLPVGVRTALTSTDSRTTNLDPLEDLGPEQLLQALQNDCGRAGDLTRPLRAGRLDNQHALLQLHARRALDRRRHRGAPRKTDLAR